MPFPLTHRSWPCDSYAHCPNSTHKMYYIFPSQEDSLVPHSSFFYTSYATVCYSLWIYGLQHIYQIITGCYQHVSKYHIYLSGTGLLHSIWFFSSSSICLQILRYHFWYPSKNPLYKFTTISKSSLLLRVINFFSNFWLL